MANLPEISKTFRFRLLLCLILPYLFFTGCGLAPSSSADQAVHEAVFSGFSLTSADHPELNFGFASDESPSIRDFCVTANQTVLILDFSSQHVLEYDFAGNLLKNYDFHLAERGLTACKIAGDAQGRIYLLDSYNNAILTTGENGVENISNLSFAEADLITQMYVNPNDDALWVTISQLEHGEDSCRLDVSGKEARVVSEPVPGSRLSDFLTFRPVLQYNADGTLSDHIQVELYQNGEKSRVFTLTSHTSEDVCIVGLNLYGVVNGDYWGKLYERIPDNSNPTGSRLQETFLRIQSGTSVPMACGNPLPEADLRQSYGNETYIIHFTGAGLSFRRLADVCQTWSPASQFEISWE